MSPRRRPRDTMIAAARALCLEGVGAAELRERLVAAHGVDAANALVSRLRAAGELPPRAAKLETMQLSPSPAVRDRLRRLAGQRGVSPRRLAHEVLAKGLAAMERAI